MSKTGRINHRRGNRGRPKAERHISVRSVRRDPPDLHKFSRAVIAIALREAELDAEAKAGVTTADPAQSVTETVDDHADHEQEQPHD